MAARGPQNGRRGLESGLPLGFGRSRKLSQNMFFDPSTPSMRKGDDREKQEKKKTEGKKRGGEKKKENNDENSGH